MGKVTNIYLYRLVSSANLRGHVAPLVLIDNFIYMVAADRFKNAHTNRFISSEFNELTDIVVI